MTEKVEVIAYSRSIERDEYLLKLSNGETLKVSFPKVLSILKSLDPLGANFLANIPFTPMSYELLSEVANHILEQRKDED